MTNIASLTKTSLSSAQKVTCGLLLQLCILLAD